MTLFEMLHDGSPWLLLVELMLFAGVVIGLFTRRGSGISSHPYTKPASGGQLASDLPPESLGRMELEPRLWRRRRHTYASQRRNAAPRDRLTAGTEAPAPVSSPGRRRAPRQP